MQTTAVYGLHYIYSKKKPWSHVQRSIPASRAFYRKICQEWSSPVSQSHLYLAQIKSYQQVTNQHFPSTPPKDKEWPDIWRLVLTIHEVCHPICQLSPMQLSMHFSPRRDVVWWDLYQGSLLGFWVQLLGSYSFIAAGATEYSTFPTPGPNPLDIPSVNRARKWLPSSTVSFLLVIISYDTLSCCP